MTSKEKPLDKSPQHALVRRLWEAQLGNASDADKRLMAEAATELECHLPADAEFIERMRKGHLRDAR